MNAFKEKRKEGARTISGISTRQLGNFFFFFFLSLHQVSLFLSIYLRAFELYVRSHPFKDQIVLTTYTHINNTYITCIQNWDTYLKKDL